MCAECCSVVQCVAVSCSVLQRVAVCCKEKAVADNFEFLSMRCSLSVAVAVCVLQMRKLQLQMRWKFPCVIVQLQHMRAAVADALEISLYNTHRHT